MSTTIQHPLLKNTKVFTNSQEQAILSETKNHIIENVASVDQTKDIIAENSDSSNSEASEDADAEMSWLAKVFDPTIQKVERWEEDWDTESESESSANS